MDIKMEDISHMKNGRYILIDGNPSKIVDIQRSAPGKHGHSKYRISAIGVFDGKKRVMLKPGHTMIEVPIIEKKSAQVLSIGTKSKQTHEGEIIVKVANVMDQESYETFDMEIPEELTDKVIEGTAVMYWTVMGKKIMKEIKK